MSKEKLSPIAQKLSEADEEELKRCREKPVYFFNRYVRKEGQPVMTEADYDHFIESVKRMRHKVRLRPHENIMLPKDCIYISTSNETT